MDSPGLSYWMFLFFVVLCSLGVFYSLRKQIVSSKQREDNFAQDFEKARERVARLQEEVVRLQAVLDMERQVAVERKKMAAEMEAKLKYNFESLSQKALAKSQSTFLELAKKSFAVEQEKASGNIAKEKQSIEHLVKPIEKSLKDLDQGMRHLEKERKADQASIKTLMQTMIDSEKELKQETSTLSRALKAPLTGGRWGEIQLKRVIELSGMLNRCDFYEQVSSSDGQYRPDVVILLPDNKKIIVDAKTSSSDYLEAMETDQDQVREEKFQKHSASVKRHIQSLGKKAYFDQFKNVPEFVVLFIPSDHFLTAALKYDPTLLEMGAKMGVILATPSTLIGMLRAIAYGWKQQVVYENTDKIRDLGEQLYKRLSDLSEHWARVGKALSQSVEAYNKSVGCLESRVIVSAKKFEELGISSEAKKLKSLQSVASMPRVPVLDQKS
ncbi:DNA recombination protein RmuC [Candidatus Aerophobetes bacterium]|uniref:DNA recombination protein RmuC n=1 Tax=Aerophobetes bacterium TaxID=2030807 RepID=A0A2A4X5R8_UNCAE|nr:MAG: DNA recombination protein RmuC [Candidatus Aerophobetes bacterium]